MLIAGVPAAGRTFIDFGCGKGRELLLASDYPFDCIIGVEFSPELVEVARRNLATCKNPNQISHNICIVAADAASYQLPEDPLVLYFYNPFNALVMQSVMSNLRDSLQRLPRPVTLIYCTPQHDSLLAAVPILKRHVSGSNYSIYQSIAHAKPLQSSTC
jgi:SAM-dependent methyltransferase